jgi:hypothetical protein
MNGGADQNVTLFILRDSVIQTYFSLGMLHARSSGVGHETENLSHPIALRYFSFTDVRGNVLNQAGRMDR